jgi:hypothetical protein
VLVLTVDEETVEPSIVTVSSTELLMFESVNTQPFAVELEIDELVISHTFIVDEAICEFVEVLFVTVESVVVEYERVESVIVDVET